MTSFGEQDLAVYTRMDMASCATSMTRLTETSPIATRSAMGLRSSSWITGSKSFSTRLKELLPSSTS